MRAVPYLFIIIFFLFSCSTGRKKGNIKVSEKAVQVWINLVDIDKDQVQVKVKAPPMGHSEISYQFPKIIPGTYAIADYGRYIENIKAFDKNGAELPVARTDTNTVLIKNADKLDYLTYLVNDTFDSEEGGDVFSSNSTTIFSPAGTCIDAEKYFLLNLAGFVGYFTGELERPYRITISHPDDLFGTTAMVDLDEQTKTDVFELTRYPEVVDHPLMYAAPDTARFSVDGMDVLLGVYSRRGATHASALKSDLEKMVRAQKKFLGKINDTKKYAVLTYISSGSDDDAKGIGALEHNTSTSAVFREPMKSKDLIHVISHEFFHTIAPLKVHSREIQFFDFNAPKMSRHLWFYEGVTEYFSNLFQVNQGLINDNQFYDLMARKLENSKQYNDKLSFIEMSRNILDVKMKPQYPNVYEKGALIAMCVDIIIREESNGEKGLLWLMDKLSQKFGPDNPFNDDELIPVITQMTSESVGAFLKTHVEQGNPIHYDSTFAKVGLKKETVLFPEPVVFISQGVNYFKTDSAGTQVMADVPDDENKFYKALGVLNNDVFLAVNGVAVDPNDLTSIIFLGYDLDEGSPVVLKIIRDGKEMDLKGEVVLNYEEDDSYRLRDETKKNLNRAWLKN